MLLKQNSPSLPRNKAFRVFLEIGNSVFSKGKSAIPPLFNGPEVLPSASDKAKLFSKTFLRSIILMTCVSVYLFPSRTNLKLHNIYVTLKMVKKVITNLDSSKTSGPDCIPVVVLKNCEPELFYIPPELFSMYLKVLFSRLLEDLFGCPCI